MSNAGLGFFHPHLDIFEFSVSLGFFERERERFYQIKKPNLNLLNFV